MKEIQFFTLKSKPKEFEKIRIIEALARKNVNEANVTVAKVMIAVSLFSYAFLLLFQFGVFHSDSIWVWLSLFVIPCTFFGVSVLCLIRRGRGTVFQYLLFFLMIFFIFFFDLMSGFKARLLYGLPILLSIRYYSRHFLSFVTFFSILALAVSMTVGTLFYDSVGFLDLNSVYYTPALAPSAEKDLMQSILELSPDKVELFRAGIIKVFIPHTLIILLFAFSSYVIMKKNPNLLLALENASRRDAEQKAELTETKTKLMLSQIQPHFLYNTLSSIAYLCTMDPQKAKKTTVTFTKYLRKNISSISAQAPVPFEEELSHTKAYLEIEALRFGDRIRVVFDTPVTDFSLPTLTLQPLAENAVKHGICKKEEGGTLTVSTRETDTHYAVTVSDDGVGFDTSSPEFQNAEHVGISNVRKRIKAQSKGELIIESTPGKGTASTILIPKSN